MRQIRFKAPFNAIVLASAALFLLSACGGSSEEGNSTSGPSDDQGGSPDQTVQRTIYDDLDTVSPWRLQRWSDTYTGAEKTGEDLQKALQAVWRKSLQMAWS